MRVIRLRSRISQLCDGSWMVDRSSIGLLMSRRTRFPYVSNSYAERIFEFFWEQSVTHLWRHVYRFVTCKKKKMYTKKFKWFFNFDKNMNFSRHLIIKKIFNYFRCGYKREWKIKISSTHWERRIYLRIRSTCRLPSTVDRSLGWKNRDIIRLRIKIPWLIHQLIILQFRGEFFFFFFSHFLKSNNTLDLYFMH